MAEQKKVDWNEIVDLLTAKTTRHIHPPDLKPCMCTNSNRLGLPIPLFDEGDDDG
jgi:hypothetical protein